MSVRPTTPETTTNRPPIGFDYNYPPRGMRRPDAARYVGISPSKFDDWVARQIMPSPKQQDSIVVWDRLALDAAMDALPDRDSDMKADPYGEFGL